MDPVSHPVAGPVLGIETSCDETAVAVLAADGRVLAERVLSQAGHAEHGGVVPEIAARAHLAHLPRMVAGVLEEVGIGLGELGAVAATLGPGLIGGLLVGANYGKGLALALGLPFVAVNHLEAHALTPRLPGLELSGLGRPGLERSGVGLAGPVAGGMRFPYLLLLLSGGHTQAVAVEGLGRYRRLGTTLDDAAGEAFDKAAKLLGLGWPGGPALERLAARGDATRFALPRPMLGRPGCDFSFSGLKTALAQEAARLGAGALAAQDAADLAAGFQAAVAAALADRARHAAAMLRATHPGLALMVVSGGVAANQALRAALATAARAEGLVLVAPPPRLCGDNAVMVAWAAIERLRVGAALGPEVLARPRWPLDDALLRVA